MVQAWRGAGKPQGYETRLLGDLPGFAAAKPVPLDRYGGWIGEKHEATGYFHPLKINGRWWLIDPRVADPCTLP